MLGFCQSPAGLSFRDAAKPPGCREDARCRRGPLQGQAPCNPTLSHHNPTSNPLPGSPSPLACADNTTSVPHLKGALSGGCRCPGFPFPGPAALLPYGIRGAHGGCPRFPGAWGSQWHLLCLPVAKGVPVCPPPSLSCEVRPLKPSICAAPSSGRAGAGTRISAAHSVRWEWEGLDPAAAAHSVDLINKPR